ncbi:MAG: hypothetical protein WD294_13725 [Phycisphaeraceae bacterium]
MRPQIGLCLDIGLHDRTTLDLALPLLQQLRVEHVRLPIRASDQHRPHANVWYRRLFDALSDCRILPVFSCAGLDAAMPTIAEPRDRLAVFVDRFLSEHGQHFDTVQIGDEVDPTQFEIAADIRRDDPFVAEVARLHRAAACAQRHNKRTVLAGLRRVCGRFLKAVTQVGGLEHIDVVAAHVQPHAGSPFAEGSAFVSFLHLKRHLASLTDRPTWITTAACPTTEDPTATAAFVESAATAPFQRLYWNPLLAQPAAAGPCTALATAAGSPRPAFHHLRQLLAEKQRLQEHGVDLVAGC